MALPVPGDAGSVLPPLYGAWMDEFLGSPIPGETEATCSDCAMCGGDEGQVAGSGYYFEPNVKCCSFVPELPSFLVGRALVSKDALAADGLATLEARLASGVAVTPLGLGRHPSYQVLYDHVTELTGFGRSRAIRCPHYMEGGGGLCGIWQHRESTCATWFCKHVRGQVGKRFWDTIQQLLSAIEGALVHWCILELDPGPEAWRRLLRSPSAAGGGDPIQEGQISGVPEPEFQRANWGRWAGREKEFFRECARLVNDLNWPEITRICGPKVRILAELTRKAFDELISSSTPSPLRVGEFGILQAGHDASRIVGYSPLDPIELPKPVLNVLPYFDGRPTDEVLQTIAAKTGIRIDEGLVRKLADFEILVTAVPPRQPD